MQKLLVKGRGVGVRGQTTGRTVVVVVVVVVVVGGGGVVVVGGGVVVVPSNRPLSRA